MTTQDMNRTQRRAAQKHLSATNANLPIRLQEIPRSEWPSAGPDDLLHVWRSKTHLVQAYHVPLPTVLLRLSINRTQLNGVNWLEGIAWEDMQRIKLECGFGDCDAVEVFPKQRDIVNVANMRHLWIMLEQLDFAWRKST